MRPLILFIGLLISTTGLSQNSRVSKPVTFVVRFHLSALDKDEAAVLKGYVVKIGDEMSKSLDGKLIRITGHYRVIKSQSSRTPGVPIVQERQGSYKYIEFPKIKVL